MAAKKEKSEGSGLQGLKENPQIMMAVINSGRERLAMMQQEMAQLNSRMAEIDIAIKTLQYMEKNQDERLMLPIGAGVYIQAGIPKDSQIYSEIGSGAILKKDRKEALEILEDAKGKAEQLQRQILIEQSQITAKINETSMKLQEMMGQKK
ncbi:MAG: prefoldin subunit alpha [Candidatus Diapherotrites archaeon]|nr:prefoldin subunit alpha [Candidatus Diapherotrites archaeon]